MVHITVEMRDDGRPHELPFARFPRLGGFADWEDLIKLGVRMEWKTLTGQWFSTYLQPERYRTLDSGDPPNFYFPVSNLNAMLRGLEYQNISEQRTPYSPFRVLEVHDDWLKQVMVIEERIKFTKVPEPKIWPATDSIQTLQDLGFKLINEELAQKRCDTCRNLISMTSSFNHVPTKRLTLLYSRIPTHVLAEAVRRSAPAKIVKNIGECARGTG